MSRRKIRYYSPKRRAIYARGEKIDSLVVFERDDWTCVVCTKKIDRRLRYPNWFCATIEHIIPLCQGGTHTLENVAASHLICNLRRGEAPLEPKTITG